MLKHGYLPFFVIPERQKLTECIDNVRAAGKGVSLSNRPGKAADNPSAAYSFYRATVATKLTLESKVVVV
ncbi:hypothetical protein [Pseudomonas syringae group sp. J309-1]|uniref:hypothetical protein n=1 Tax=Pseudomonas syringae group sp. J309-1 TaxID=3079588 RepID=UPI0029073D71|nr:hypothetical protein [Pseudomonas syringae group sp. J309-1]MDU8362385.1 hypothetical protein [Pseudomonas syringae group sp. J309-1]